jgi:hypothetical protein
MHRSDFFNDIIIFGIPKRIVTTQKWKTMIVWEQLLEAKATKSAKHLKIYIIIARGSRAKVRT